MWLINWLSDRASKVLDWFGSFYWSARSRLSNFWSYLQSYAEKAYRWSREWALPKIFSYYRAAQDWAGARVQEVRSWASSAIDHAVRWLSSSVEEAKSLARGAWRKAEGAWETVSARVLKEITAAEVGLRAWSRTKIEQALQPFKWIESFKDFLKEIKTLLDTERRKRLIMVLDDYFSFLLQLVTSPLQTMLSFLQPILLELLAFSLAYALGTEEAELPAFPAWSGGAGGRLPGPGVPPPTVKRDLSSPLAHLRVSGYRFREGHRALDLGLQNGTEVFAMHEGIVEYINYGNSGYGNQLTLGGGPWWSRYAHLQRVLVRRGQAVSKGELIAYGDNTGNSTGPHLHLEIKFQGQFVDPESILF